MGCYVGRIGRVKLFFTYQCPKINLSPFILYWSLNCKWRPTPMFVSSDPTFLFETKHGANNNFRNR